MKTKRTLALMLVALSTAALGCAAEPSASVDADEGMEMEMEGEETGTTTQALATVAGGFRLVPSIYVFGAHHGGTGGQESRLACRSGDVAVGFYGSYGTYTTELGLICAPLKSNGTFGPRYSTVSRGSPGAVPFRWQCASNEYLSGFTGYSGTYLDVWLGGACTKLPSFALGTRYQWQTSEGRPGGRPFRDDCPGSYGVTSLQIRAASWIDGFRPICTYIDH